MSLEAVLYNQELKRWQRYSEPVEVVEARKLGEVLPALEQLEQRVADGLHAAGFICYEASGAFDEALTTHQPTMLPLLQFGLYKQPEPFVLPAAQHRLPPLEWRAAIAEDFFVEKVAAIRAAIARGETYQVNLTFPMTATINYDPWSFFLQLVQRQNPACCGFLQSECWAICSASPELFFTRDGNLLTMRPMKGTAPRGRTLFEDQHFGEGLKTSEKNRAENIMILDMVRNDLGRIAPPGEVTTEAICTLEKHSTVWQLTSTVTAHSETSLVDVFRALFPCASITGAPKTQTMQIIADTESTPRGLYTGVFGWLAPNRKAQFSVAIRTTLIDRMKNHATYGVGAGITWDSVGVEEFRECLDKAAILSTPAEDFALIETMRWTPHHGYFLLDEHLARLRASAEYFDFTFDMERLQQELEKQAGIFPRRPLRVRLLHDRHGQQEITFQPLDEQKKNDIKVCFAQSPVNSKVVSLYHKTTHRELYEQNLAQSGEAEEVILWNEQGHATEGCSTNIVVARNGKLVTPALSCGLLPGTYRDYLLKKGVIEEAVIEKSELADSDHVYLINAVRKWRRAKFI